MSGQIIETIQPGNKYTYPAPGNSFACYAATAELTFSVWVGANYYDGLPLDRGTGFKAPFDRVEVYNNTAAPVTVTLIFLQIPNMPIEGFYDQRELAAQVAIDGGVQVVNSPIEDEGGVMRALGSSLYHVQHNHTAIPSAVHNIFTEAENTSGVRLKSAYFFFIQSNPNDPCYLHQRSNGGGATEGTIFIPSGSNVVDMLSGPWIIPAGKRLSVGVSNGSNMVAHVTYDIL